MVAAGLLAEEHVGRARRVWPNQQSPLYQPLAQLVALTYGPKPVLERALGGAVGVDRAFIYGSWAARYHGEVGDAPKDVDVLVVGKPDPDELFSVAEVACRSLRREVNIRSVRSAAWDAPAEADAFLAHIRSRPLVELTVEGAHPMTWQKGRDTVLALVDHGEPESITPSRDQAEAMLADARRHLQSAKAIAPIDPQPPRGEGSSSCTTPRGLSLTHPSASSSVLSTACVPAAIRSSTPPRRTPTSPR